MIVQKFGGIAVQDEEMRKNCIMQIKKGVAKYGKVIVVVSAMGRLGNPYATDSLLNLTKSFAYSPQASDLVASCGELIATSVLSAELQQSGMDNKILHGKQTGIITTSEFGHASIIRIDPTTIINNFSEINCILIPGFQGMDEFSNVMTLGRGGSDLTATALAAALNASHAEFYKDVPGVMTGDPAILPESRKIDKMSFDQFIELLNCEKPIIQMRAAQHAKKTATPLYIRGITGNEKGTWIT